MVIVEIVEIQQTLASKNPDLATVFDFSLKAPVMLRFFMIVERIMNAYTLI